MSNLENERDMWADIVRTEPAKCDFVLANGDTCDAPAPHCIGGTEYFCDEHVAEDDGMTVTS